jgi:hypothetical protein
MIWDYHVICLQRQLQADGTTSTTMVWDLDTALGFPCSFQEYFQQALRSNSSLRTQFHR